MKTKNLLLAVLFLLIGNFSFPAFSFAQGNWTQKADFPGTGRWGAVCFSIGTKAYIGIGDITYEMHSGFKDFWEWDQSTNVWTKKADYPGNSGGVAVGFSIGTKGYVGTGSKYGSGGFTNDFWEYNSETNIWTQKATLPGANARSEAVGFSIGAKGYIGTGNLDVNGGGENYCKDFWEWDQATNVWTQKADFGGGLRDDAVGFSIGTKGYIGIGEDVIGGNVVAEKDFWEWDQSTNVWTKKADYPGNPGAIAVGFSIGTKGYIGMGLDKFTMTAFNDFWEWDQNTNIWVQKANFGGISRFGTDGFSIGNKGYIGIGGDGTTFYHDFWEYNPSGTTGIAEMAKETIFIYPNPANDILTLNFDNGNNADLTLNIYNITGELVRSETLRQNQQQINIGELSNGIYMVEIKSNGWSENQKLIIQR